MKRISECNNAPDLAMRLLELNEHWRFSDKLIPKESYFNSADKYNQEAEEAKSSDTEQIDSNTSETEDVTPAPSRYRSRKSLGDTTPSINPTFPSNAEDEETMFRIRRYRSKLNTKQKPFLFLFTF